MNKTPKVSVCMIAYNHQDYIKQAIEGVLMQLTNFEIELIISNDCSFDDTNLYVEQFINTHPKGHLITYFEQELNLGMIPNFILALKQCKGKYIAICEGDDYWTDQLKLQKQVDFLEANQDVNICFHRADVLRDSKLSLHQIPEPFNKTSFKYIELLKHYNFIATASVIFKKPEKFEFPNWFNKLPFGDLGLYKLVSENNKIQCLDEVMCVYRVHDKGIYSGLDTLKAQQNYLSFYKVLFPVLNLEEKEIVRSKIREVTYKISKLKFPDTRWFQKLYNRYLRFKSVK